MFIFTAIMPAHAISEAYRHQLDSSGCTQMNEGFGCDIHNAKKENMKFSAIIKLTQNISTSLLPGNQWARRLISWFHAGGRKLKINLHHFIRLIKPWF